MISVTSASRYITSASRYHPRYESISSMYIRGLISWNFAELAEAATIDIKFPDKNVNENCYHFGIQYNFIWVTNVCAIYV